MPKIRLRRERLTMERIAKIKPHPEKVRTLGDGGRGSNGLRVRVLPSGAASWYQQLRVNGKLTNLGLGSLTEVTLDEARKAAARNVLTLDEGDDPRRNPLKRQTRRRPGIKLRDCVAAVIELKRPTWKDADRMERQWWSVLEQHANAMLDAPVADVTASDALALLQPILETAPTQADKVKSRLAEACRWAAVQKHRADSNPFTDVDAVLPRRNGNGHKPHRALPYADTADAIRSLRACRAWKPKALAVEFQILTAVRPSEALGARWSEIDLDNTLWTIPATRMKAKQEHRVPLSNAAIDVLRRARPLSQGDVVFPSTLGKPMVVQKAGETVAIAKLDCTAHGFRSTFSDWALEQADSDEELVNLCLAHKRRNAVSAAYLRTTRYEQRRELMQRWADYLRPQ